MLVRYIYSACVVITTPDVRILTDPWFTPGAFDGSWYQFPPIADPIETIGEVDIIYLSHIHADHYDPVFLRKYLAKYPKARIITGKTEPPYLERKLRIDGFAFELVDQLTIGGTKLAIFQNQSHDIDIDTSLAVVAEGQSIVNMNDNSIDHDQINKMLEFVGGKVTFALLPYSGATNHPHSLAFPSNKKLLEAAAIREKHFLDIYASYLDLFKPKKALPFAGKYYFGGYLSHWNNYRGAADAITAKRLFPDITVVLADGGKAVFNLNTLTASAERTEPYDQAEIQNYLNNKLDFKGYDFQRELKFIDHHVPPLVPIINTAIHKARQRHKVEQPLWICIRPYRMNKYLCFDMVNSNEVTVRAGKKQAIADLEPRLEIYIDDSYLFGLLTRLYHWNNAMGGSLYRYARTPDEFRRDALDFLDVFHV